MKIAIQQNDSGLFLMDLDNWVPEFGRAKQFQDLKEAEEFCLAHSLSDVSIAVRYRDE